MRGKLHNSINGVEVSGRFEFTHLDLCWCERSINHQVILSPTN